MSVSKLNKKIFVTLCMNYFSEFEIEKLLIESESIIRIYLFKIFFYYWNQIYPQKSLNSPNNIKIIDTP